ncbi:ATP-binding protein [bacterium]|nr:ATP-binding protein [bacterium]
MVEEYLAAAGAVCIEGCKWCGKTWTSEHHSKSAVYIGDPAGNYSNRTLAQISPLSVLEGETPRLIDEWQEVPPLWDAVRNVVDKRALKGQFILTGSATPNREGKMHSGAGRIAKLRMRPMSLFESCDSSGKISLQALCKGEFENELTGEVDLSELIYLVVRGGWPGNIGSAVNHASILAESYIQAVLDEDIERVETATRDRAKMTKLLRSLARNESTAVSNRTLQKDISDKDGSSLELNTIASYLEVFEKLFLFDNIPPFSPNIRSSVRIKQQEKRHLADPSLACALLRANPNILLNDLNTLGFLFEALCERDLRIYAESFGGNLYHYQDYSGKEIDAVIEMSDGSWSAVEIKLGAHQIDEAAHNLLSIKKAFLADEKSVPPSSLIVVCGMTNAAYLRPDGVYVVPITALKN